MGDPGDGGALQRVKSYTWPAGHVAHLTEGQTGALEKFKILSEKKGYYSPGDATTPPTHDDETLLRYLRARKFLPQEAFVQFKNTEDWRKENQLDKLYENIDVQEYDQTRRLHPQWTGRRDKRGIPLYVFEIAEVDPKEVSAYTNSKDSKKQFKGLTTPWKMLKLFALYENLCRFVLPLCSALPDRPNAETPISQSNNIVDLRGVGFGKLWTLRNHMSDSSKLATSYYPETLDRIFVIGAPSYFETIWKWAQSWFDPITVAKIFILSHKEMASKLQEYIDIDDIPEKYGGRLKWKFGDMPVLDPGIANNLHWYENIEVKGRRTLPIGPIKWQYDEKGDLITTAIGTENGKPRNRVIAGLHSENSVAKLALSPGRVLSNTSQAQTTKPTTTTIASETKLTNGTMSHDQPTSEDTPASLPTTTSTETTAPSATPQADPSHSLSSSGREGTSSTRFIQQQGTHAEGELASTTPEVLTYGYDRPAVIEPATVGQAPKEWPRPELEEHKPTMMEQAQQMAGQVVEQAQQLPGTVMAAVGMREKKEDTPTETQSKKGDERIDNMEGVGVEEFLRSQTRSRVDGR